MIVFSYCVREKNCLGRKPSCLFFCFRFTLDKVQQYPPYGYNTTHSIYSHFSNFLATIFKPPTTEQNLSLEHFHHIHKASIWLCLGWYSQTPLGILASSTWQFHALYDRLRAECAIYKDRFWSKNSSTQSSLQTSLMKSSSWITHY